MSLLDERDRCFVCGADEDGSGLREHATQMEISSGLVSEKPTLQAVEEKAISRQSSTSCEIVTNG